MASLTVSIESLIATMEIDAFEGRSMAIFDVPEAYLHADMPEDKRILLKLTGKYVEIMCEVNWEHEKNVIYENEKSIILMGGKGFIWMYTVCFIVISAIC